MEDKKQQEEEDTQLQQQPRCSTRQKLKKAEEGESAAAAAAATTTETTKHARGQKKKAATKKAKAEEPVQQTLAPLVPTISNLPLLCWPLWRENVLSYLQPTDLVVLTHVSQEYSRLMRSDAVWEPWVVQMTYEGRSRYLEALKEYKTLPFQGKTLMDAYIAATTSKCDGCGCWTPWMNMLTVRPTCWSCFKSWAGPQVMAKSNATLQYLLSTKEANSLPSIPIDLTRFSHILMFKSITLVLRAHAEQLARERYPDGLVGLERDREARKQKARAGRAKVLENYAKRKAEALKAGKRAPKYPKESSLLKSDINEAEDGWAKTFYDNIFRVVGFRRKNEPATSLAGTNDPTSVLVCPHCRSTDPNQPEQEMNMWPTQEEFMKHVNICPNFDMEEMGGMEGYGFDGY